jgi:alkanesulfonate monooxygenase SsuD/methylene tetrahydromethanopterin reductase-like flavin-dependent oxidoreductase (luciferase family)
MRLASPISPLSPSSRRESTWSIIAQIYRRRDDWGYDSLAAFDHFYLIFTPDPAGPCMENWTLLGALSQHTKRARIGAMVTPTPCFAPRKPLGTSADDPD